MSYITVLNVPGTRLEYSGQTVHCQEKMIFRHNGILFYALLFTPDKPAFLRCHAQAKHLVDAGRINPHYHTAPLRATTELLRHNTHAAISVHQPDGGDVIPAYAAAKAVTKSTQVMNMLCRHNDLNSTSLKPHTNLLCQRIHPLTECPDFTLR